VKAAILTFAAVSTSAVAIAAGAARAPEALRSVDEFRVTQVVVHGASHLEPGDVLTMSGIGPASSVFDDVGPWRSALLAHPLVLDARIERELPGTIEIFIEETTPIAFAPTPELRPVDARGNVLPVRRGHTPLDLPVIAAGARLAALDSTGVHPAAQGFTRIVDEPTLALLAALVVIRARDPVLEAAISEMAPLPGGGLRLTLRRPAGTQILLATPVDAARLRMVAMTLAHLGESAGQSRIDARFDEQVVVQALDGRTGGHATASGAR